MTVSAIIPCYNAEATISRAINSVLEQTVHIDEIIVVNDGSTDNSLIVLNHLKKPHTRLIIINQDNAGVSNARNTAIAIAKGTFILTLDADDYYEFTFVEKALEKFKENDAYGGVMCGYVRIVDGRKILPYIPEIVTLESCLLHNGVLSCLLFKKEAILTAGGYDELMTKGYEDWDLNIRILKAGYTFGIVNEVLFNYSDTIDSRTYGAIKNDVSLRLQMYDKYKKEYEHFGKYVFEGLIKKNNKLKNEKQQLLETTSFKIGHKVTSTARGIMNFFNKRSRT